MESHIRSIVKALTWRLGGTVVTFLVAWCILGHIRDAIEIGFLDTLVKFGAYYAHERVWGKITWGRPRKPEYYI